MNRFARPIRALIPLALLCGALAARDAVFADAGPPEARLATQLAQAATLVLRQEPLTLEALELAAILAEEAANLAPDDAELWRLVYGIASLGEQDELRAAALERITTLEPADDVVRLRWVSHQLRRHQTGEDLAAALERLLEPRSRERLGPAVSSRLALDLAMLERRRGDDERFANRLAQAVALDPSNQHAASFAAGYFQMHVDDPAAEGELLVQLLLSNPASVENAILLAAHLLGHGAYTGASRFYDMALRAHAAMHMAAPADLVADAAIAQFGRGDQEAAIRLLAQRQREANVELQRHLQQTRPDLEPRDRAPFVAAMTTTFAAVRAAIHQRAGMDMAMQLGLAGAAYEAAVAELAQMDNIEEDERRRRTALLRLEQAWVLVWLGGEMARVDEALEAARAIAEISPTAARRFDGWKALRRGEFENVIATLEEIAPDDTPSRLGLALALMETNRHRDAARELLTIARAQPGTLIGVYAADVLAQLLGRRVPLSSEAADLEALAAKFPRGLDRIASEPTTAIGFSVIPQESRYAPHAPLIVNIEIINNSPVPLAIDPSGPIQPEIVLLPSIQVVGTRGGTAPPIVVGIDRRLMLMPRERLLVPVDLRRTPLGDVLDQVAVAGAIVRVRGILNFRATPEGALITGLLGSESRPPSLWLDGVRLTPQWMEQSLANLSDYASGGEGEGARGTADDLTRLAQFGLAVAGDPAGAVTEEEQRLIDDARQSASEAFTRSTPAAQAWLLAVWPERAQNRSAPIEGYADHRLVRMGHVLFRARDVNDPLLTEALRSEDATLRRMAALIQQGAAGDAAALRREAAPPARR